MEREVSENESIYASTDLRYMIDFQQNNNYNNYCCPCAFKYIMIAIFHDLKWLNFSNEVKCVKAVIDKNRCER